MTRTSRRAPAALIAAALVVIGAGCSGGGDSDAEDAGTGTTDAADSSDAGDTDGTAGTEDEADDVAEPDESEAPEDTSEPDDPPATSTTVAGPQGEPLVDGLAPIELLGPPETDAGAAPLFSWGAVDGAATYRLALLGPEGPIWSWTGETTEVYLGGLEFEQPAGWAGPQLVDGSCWSVSAHDAAGDVIAVSGFVSVSAGPDAGPACVPPGG